jgi:hypothetical protein
MSFDTRPNSVRYRTLQPSSRAADARRRWLRDRCAPACDSGEANASSKNDTSNSRPSPSTGLPEMLAADGAGGHSAVQGPCRHPRSDLQMSEMRALRKLDRQSDRSQIRRRGKHSSLGCGNRRPRFCRIRVITQLRRISLRLLASIRRTLRRCQSPRQLQSSV